MGTQYGFVQGERLLPSSLAAAGAGDDVATDAPTTAGGQHGYIY